MVSAKWNMYSGRTKYIANMCNVFERCSNAFRVRVLFIFSSCSFQERPKKKTKTSECERNPMKYRMLDEKFQSRFSFYNDTIYSMERYYILFDSSKRTCHLLIFAYKTQTLTIIVNFLWFSDSQLSLSLCQPHWNRSGGAHACILSCLCPNQNKHRVNNILRHSIHVHSKSFWCQFNHIV